MDVKLPTRLEVEIERAGEGEGYVVKEVQTRSLSHGYMPVPQLANTPVVTPSVMTVGKALLVLSHSHQDDFINSVVGDTESLARKAFQSLDHHLRLDSTLSVATTITVAVLDKGVNTQKRNESAPLVLFWWIFMRHSSIFVDVIKNIIAGLDYDKSIQLSVCTAVIYVVKKLNKITNDEISYNKSDIINELAEVLPPLSALIQKSNSATRLSVTASNCLLCIAACLSNEITSSRTFVSRAPEKRIVVISDNDAGSLAKINQNGPNLFVTNLDAILNSLKNIKTWYQTSRSLLYAALSDIIKSYEILRQDNRNSDLILRSWKIMVPFLNLAPNKHYLQKSSRKAQELLAKLKSKDASSDMDYFQAICVVLHSSSLSKKDFLDFMDSVKDTFIPFLMNMTLSFQQGYEVATSLLMCSLFEKDRFNLFDNITKLIPPVLHYNVPFSPNTIDLLARIIIWETQSSQSILKSVVVLLSDIHPQVRMNMADIIVGVLKLKCSDSSRQTINLAVLAHLDNSYLVQKIGSETLYSELDTKLFIPNLVGKIYSTTNEQGRSAATSIVTNIVRYSADSLCPIRMLLEIYRSSNAPISPANFSQEKKDPEVILGVLHDIARQLDESFWNSLLSELVTSYLKSPQDTVMVKFFVKISAFIGRHLNVVLPILVSTMQEQKGLTEEMLLSPNSEETVKSLIFERLAPLLVLKVVPYTFYSSFCENSQKSNQSLLSTTSELLLTRMTQLYEFEEVRRVSAQVLSYLPPSVWATRSLQIVLSSIRSGDHYTAKICIFTWFNGLSIQGLDLEEHVHHITSVILSILIIEMPQGKKEEILKLQKGALDCFAMLIKVAAMRPKGCVPFSQPVSTQQYTLDFPFSTFLQQNLANFNDILPMLMQLTLPPFPLLNQLLSLTPHEKDKNYTAEWTVHLRLKLLDSISISIQACNDGGRYSIAQSTFSPLLNALLMKNIPTVLTTSYFQVVVSLISNIKTEVSNFISDLSDFCFASYEVPEKWPIVLKVVTTVCIYEPAILTTPSNGRLIIDFLLSIQKQIQNPEDLQLINNLLIKSA